MAERALGEPTESHNLMRLARHIPRILDSRRADGGVLRLLTDPGGFAATMRGGRAVGKTGDDGAIVAVAREGGTVERASELPLLLQHAVESDVDFAFRAAIAAPRDLFWHSAGSLAGRPFARKIEFGGKLPGELEDGGEIEADVDLRGNDVRAFLSEHTADSAGYGLGYILVDWSEERKRRFWRWIEADSVPAVTPGVGGLPQQIEVAVNTPEGRELLVFRRGSVGGPAMVSRHRPAASGGFEPKPFEPPTALAPFVEIPLVPLATGGLSASHFNLPPLLSAAKLDYLLLQVTSNVEFASIVANTFIRFAKGVRETDIDAWAPLGTKLFYATTSPDADMKWIHLPADALKAGLDLVESITRALEVAGLAPMLSRAPGNERATGQAISSARAMTLAEAYVLRWSSAASRAYAMLGVGGPSLSNLAGYSEADPPKLSLHHDFGIAEGDLAAARMLVDMYLKPEPRIERVVFWGEMQRFGVIGEQVDVTALARWVETAEQRQAKEARAVEKARLLVDMAKEGFFSGPTTRRQLYEAMIDHGVLPKSFDTEQAVAEDVRTGTVIVPAGE